MARPWFRLPLRDQATALSATRTHCLASEATIWSGEIDLAGATDSLRVVVEELEPGLRDEAGVGVPVETVVYWRPWSCPRPETEALDHRGGRP